MLPMHYLNTINNDRKTGTISILIISGIIFLQVGTNEKLMLQVGVGEATINYVYRGSTRKIIRRFGYPIRAFPIILAETLAIREAIRTAIHRSHYGK